MSPVGDTPTRRAAVPARPVVVERAASPRGEIVLRRAGTDFEIISNGVFLMDTRDGRSERLLVAAALDACRAPAPRVLIGGLGVGFSLAEAARATRAERIDVVEISPEIIRWHRTQLRHLAGPALADPRVRVVNADLADWLAGRPRCYDVVCLDVDNGPQWTVSEENRALYGPAGLRLISRSLRAGGVAAVWCAAPAPAFERRLRRRFRGVRALETPVARGQPDVVYLGRRRRLSARRAAGQRRPPGPEDAGGPG